MLIDTHCHIHEGDLFAGDTGHQAYDRALSHNVSKMLCVGTSEKSSREAVEFAERHPAGYAVVGVHPHEVKHGYSYVEQILRDEHTKVVGIGEVGLDYFYDNSPRHVQINALEQQLQWSRDYNLPVVFHVREAFDDFWPIFDNFEGINGVLHSFTDSRENLNQALKRGLYIGVNGISTFTKDEEQRRTFNHIPLDRLLLETDAPFLTPVPYRGKVNEPAYVRVVAEYNAKQRGISLEEIALATTTNATALFAL